MKVDLATAIIAAAVGVILSYLITSNLILKAPTAVVIKSLGDTVSTDLSAPDPEVFNYRALNPTVEVFIDCSNYDASGSCVDGSEE